MLLAGVGDACKTAMLQCGSMCGALRVQVTCTCMHHGYIIYYIACALNSTVPGHWHQQQSGYAETLVCQCIAIGAAASVLSHQCMVEVVTARIPCRGDMHGNMQHHVSHTGVAGTARSVMDTSASPWILCLLAYSAAAY
jgi:hypothetical protein